MFKELCLDIYDLHQQVEQLKGSKDNDTETKWYDFRTFKRTW